FDEMVMAMFKGGRSMPCELKETALGGTAATPTAIEISKKIFGKD
ncbi:MAG TPA: L-serine ammonia-lyase, iron-sulfur-dependent, subunit alpha, partial [Clostridiaceae bacterium]|nr:L-serine ammonia-lyase, iron-sulfur-dependent, subunit alpha [Clostridiaceae bacterium]